MQDEVKDKLLPERRAVESSAKKSTPASAADLLVTEEEDGAPLKPIEEAPKEFGVNLLFFRRLKRLIRLGCCGGYGCQCNAMTGKLVGIVIFSLVIVFGQLFVLNPVSASSMFAANCHS